MKNSALAKLYAAASLSLLGFATSCSVSDPSNVDVLTDGMIVKKDSLENKVLVSFVTRDSLTQHVDTADYELAPIFQEDGRVNDGKVNYTARYNDKLSEKEFALLAEADKKAGKHVHINSSHRVSEAERNLMIFKDSWQERSQNAELVKAAQEMQKKTGELLVVSRDFLNGKAGVGEKLANMKLVPVVSN